LIGHRNSNFGSVSEKGFTKLDSGSK